MNLLHENEMVGFLQTLPKFLSAEQRVKAVIDHFFENVIFPDMPKELGDRYADNLRLFIALAVAKACPNCFGLGFMPEPPDMKHTDPMKRICPICKGSGRIIIETAAIDEETRRKL